MTDFEKILIYFPVLKWCMPRSTDFSARTVQIRPPNPKGASPRQLSLEPWPKNL
jgi:hypothetical protein